MSSVDCNVAAIILAAGKGERVGCPKWQLFEDGRTFLDVIVDKLVTVNFSEIVCVVSPLSVPANNVVTLVINEKPEYGMLSSIYCGISVVNNAAGFLIWPVDHPYVQARTLNDLCISFMQNSNKVIRPAFCNRTGHPIIIPRKIADDIPCKDYAGGLKGLLTAKKAVIYNVDVDDNGILLNINTKDDYLRRDR